jgi:integrase
MTFIDSADAAMLTDKFHPGSGKELLYIDRNLRIARDIILVLVGRNVAMLVGTPKGQAGRPSKSLSLEQASALLAAAEGTRMHAYIALCLATGIRTEEARALRWENVNLGDPDARPPVSASAAVWRSVRAHGDTKTEKSRRTLGLPEMAVNALRPIRSDKRGNGSPRELRHSFVSLMSSSGVLVEEIARIAGHSSTRTTEVVLQARTAADPDGRRRSYGQASQVSCLLTPEGARSPQQMMSQQLTQPSSRG